MPRLSATSLVSRPGRIVAISGLLALGWVRFSPQQNPLGVTSTWFRAIESDFGNFVEVLGVATNRSERTIGDIHGFTLLYVNDVVVGQSSTVVALNKVLAPGQDTVLSDTVPYARAGEVDRVAFVPSGTDATPDPPAAGLEPALLNLTTHPQGDGTFYDFELLNPGPASYRAPDPDEGAIPGWMLFFSGETLVGGTELDVLPRGHYPPGIMVPQSALAPDASQHDSHRLFFAVDALAAGTFPLRWKVENLTWAIDGLLIRMSATVRNDTNVGGHPDGLFILRDENGTVMGREACTIDRQLPGGRSASCEATVHFSSLRSGQLDDVSSVELVVASMATTRDSSMAPPTPTPTATHTPPPTPSASATATATGTPTSTADPPSGTPTRPPIVKIYMPALTKL